MNGSTGRHDWDSSLEHIQHDAEAGRVEPNENSPLLVSRNDASGSQQSPWIKTELWLLFEYALPLTATYLLQYSHTIITLWVAGHLSSDDLAATSIGLTMLNLIGLAALEGMATALDTLCSQAYGAGDLHGVGFHVQRMLLLMVAVIVPIGVVWLTSQWGLPLIVKQDDLVPKAASFLHMSVVGLPGYAAFEALKRYLQAQGDCTAAFYILLVATPLNAGLSWLLAFKLDLGLKGAALGAALTNDFRALTLLAYIVFVAKSSHQCWGGFSRKALVDWGTMLRLSIAGFFMNFGEWLAFEIITISTSYLSTAHLAAMAVLSQLSVVTWHIPFSTSVAASIRVGHLIGAGLVRDARRAAAFYNVVFLSAGLFNAMMLLVLRKELPKLLTSDEYVRSIAAQTMITVAAYQILDAANVGVQGLLRGLGKQTFAGAIVFPINYLLAVPLALWLELGSPGMRIDGAWIGLGLGLLLTTLANYSYMYWLDWQKIVSDTEQKDVF